MVYDPATSILTLDGAIADGVTGDVTVTLTINGGEPNEQTATLTLTLIDPCVADVTITIGDLGWATTMFVVDPETFTVDPAADLSHVTSPAGADCGAYTVEFALVDSLDVAANPLYVTENEYSLVVDFDHDTT